MTRRGFLGAIAAAVAGGAVLDPERAFWRRGARVISIPRALGRAEWLQYGVFFEVDENLGTMETFNAMYVEAAVAALRKKIDSDLVNWRAEALEIPEGSNFLLAGRVSIPGAPESRYLVAREPYEWRALGRVDCRVKGVRRERWKTG